MSWKWLLNPRINFLVTKHETVIRLVILVYKMTFVTLAIFCSQYSDKNIKIHSVDACSMQIQHLIFKE